MQIRPRTVIILVSIIGIVAYVWLMGGSITTAMAGQYYTIAVYLDDHHEYERALQYYSKAIETDPRLERAYVARGAILTYLERYDEALADCDRALELNSYSARGYANRCVVYTEMGEFEHASQDCEKALGLAPHNGYILAGLARLSSERGDLDQAIAYYTQALLEEPEYDTVYYSRGMTYQRLGKNELALEDFRRACDMNENFFAACKALVYSCFDVGDGDTALQEADKLVAKFPGQASAYYARGWIYHQNGDTDNAISDYKHVIELDPSFEVAYWGLGDLYSSLQDTDTALGYFCQYRELAGVPEPLVLEEIELLGGCPPGTD